MLSSRTFTRGSPMKPRVRPSVWSFDQLLHLRRRTARSSRRPGGPGCPRTAGEMSGSRPEPEEVTASAGTSDGLDRVAGDRVVLDDGGLGGLHPLDQVLVVGGAVGGAGEDQLVLGVDAVGAEAVRRAALEPLQVGLPGSPGPSSAAGCTPARSATEPTTLPSDLISEPLALSWNRRLGDAGDGQRVDDARHQGQDEQGAQRPPTSNRAVFVTELFMADQPIPGMREMSRSMILMPMNGAIRPPMP